MNWSKEWKIPPVWPEAKMLEEAAPLPKEWGLGVENVVAKEALINSKGYKDSLKEGKEAVEEAVKRATNLKPTHDPYTNPNSYLYYECTCGARLDPHVKSFAALNNAAMNSEWKIRWGANGYVPYCVKCGEGVE